MTIFIANAATVLVTRSHGHHVAGYRHSGLIGIAVSMTTVQSGESF